MANHKSIWIIVIVIVGALMLYTPANSKTTSLGNGNYLYQVYSDRPSALFSILYAFGYPAQSSSSGFMTYDSEDSTPYSCGSATYTGYGLATSTSSINGRARAWINFDIGGLSSVNPGYVVDSVNLKLTTPSKSGSGNSDTINYIRSLDSSSVNCNDQTSKQNFFSQLDSGTAYATLSGTSRISSASTGVYTPYALSSAKSDIESLINSDGNTFSLAITTNEDGTRDRWEKISSPGGNPNWGPILEIEYHVQTVSLSFDELIIYANKWVNNQGVTFQQLMDAANSWASG